MAARVRRGRAVLLRRRAQCTGRRRGEWDSGPVADGGDAPVDGGQGPAHQGAAVRDAEDPWRVGRSRSSRHHRAWARSLREREERSARDDRLPCRASRAEARSGLRAVRYVGRPQGQRDRGCARLARVRAPTEVHLPRSMRTKGRGRVRYGPRPRAVLRGGEIGHACARRAAWPTRGWDGGGRSCP